MKRNITSCLLLALLFLLGSSSCILVPPTCVPTAPTPADNGNVCGAGSRTLSWPAVTDATTYDVYLNTGSAAPTTLVSADQAGTSYTTTLALGAYSWQVIPKNSAGAATGCGYWKFTVVNPVAPTVSISSNRTDTMCAGIPVTFTAAATNPGTGPFYQWKKNNVNVGSNSATYVDNAIARGDIISVTMTSNSTACLTTMTATSANDTVKSVIISIPSVNIVNDGDTSFCSGGNVTLRTTTAAPVYQWKRNGADIPGANATSYTAYQTGNYSVKASVSSGQCFAESRAIAVNSVTVYPRVNRNGNVLTTDATYSTYQWYRNYVAIPGATTASYTVSRDGVYSVHAVDNLGCSGTSAVLPVNNLAVGTIVNVDEIKVYPNPTTGMVSINSPVLLNIAVLDMQGKVILKKESANKVDLSQFAGGIYVIQLSDKNNNVIKVEKLIKKDL